MENFDQPLDAGMQNVTADQGRLRVTDNLRFYWNSTATWVRFLAITMFVMLGLIVLGLLFAAVGGAAAAGPGFGLAMLFFGVLYIAILFFPALYLWRFAQKIRTALQTDDNDLLAGGFNNLMRFYRFIGILTIAIFGLYILMAIVGVSALALFGTGAGDF